MNARVVEKRTLGFVGDIALICFLIIKIVHTVHAFIKWPLSFLIISLILV